MKQPNNRRGKTDTSLTSERSKTDEYIVTKSAKVNEVINKEINKNRDQLDFDKKNAREEIDKLKIISRSGGENFSEERVSIEHKDLLKERHGEDEAHRIERLKEDEIRKQAEAQKEHLTESILTKERLETDSNLLDERADADRETEKSTENLSLQTGLVSSTQLDLATRDQFLAVVSHDLRNPLGSISMATEIMRENINAGDMHDQLEMIDVIERNAKVMDRMITNLLDVERMTNGKLELNLKQINLCNLLEECKTLLDPLVKSKGLSLFVESCDDELMVLVDHHKILQVISNLVGNSLKFTPEGGEIKIYFECNPLKITVSDNGCGISSDDQKLLFNKFSQLKSKDRSGLGLGLFICKWIVESHKGHISVSSELDKGSKFSFTLAEE